VTGLEIFTLVVLGGWIAISLDQGRWQPGPWLPVGATRTSGADAGGRSVAIIVPARNEASILPSTLPALLRAADGARIVFVDDNSTDGTAAVARELAASSGGIDIVSPPPTPDGWAGKVHALASGVEAAGEVDWLLFTDADIRHRPGSVRDLVSLAAEGGYDLVSVMARLRADSVWERLIVPPFVFFFHLLYPFCRVDRPGLFRAAAAGGCILVRRHALERAGGLATILDAVIDDVSLARTIKRAGGRLWLGLDPEIASLRSYPRLAELWRMVTRSAFVQLGFRWILVATVTVAILVWLVSPPLVATFGAGTGHGRAALFALAAWCLQAMILLPWVRHHRAPLGYALTLPFASLLYLLMTVSSGVSYTFGRGVRWR